MKYLILVTLAAAFVLAGCGGEKQAAPAASGTAVTAPGAAAAVPELKPRAARADEMGKEAFCPVMKKKFTVNKNTAVFDYKGKAYFMCCGMCPSSFAKDPEKYVR